MDTQFLDSPAMFVRTETQSRGRVSGNWLRGLKALPAILREASDICARIDRELPAAEARANDLLRHYGI